ncbi:MAG: methyltransferase [Hyphomicrobiales bacterium]|nr:methyltransferase [Hyphomicrobiales bacterium]MBV8826049.1 methyltransferase [Hyphomicrobiales bacterium]
MRNAKNLAVTEDAVLGGRLVLRQPRRGHRFGHDAILLAASTPAKAGEHVVEFGAGVGAAGLALASRVPGLALTLVEIDRELATLAGENISRNGLADGVRAVTLDVTAGARAFAAEALPPGSAARVLMNPPFNDPAVSRASPDAGRRCAHVSAGIAPWLNSAQRLLGAGGTVTLIWRADGLGDVLSALAPGFGAITAQPVHPRADAPAVRVLVRAVKGSGAPLVLLPPLVLAGTDGRPSAEAEAVLRHGGALPLADV